MKRNKTQIEQLVNCKTKNTELFIKRIIKGCSQQFNFWQDDQPDFNSSTIWEWIRQEISFENMNMNLSRERFEIKYELSVFLTSWKPLSKAIMNRNFWHSLNIIYNLCTPDPVFKKVILARMLLEDSGIKINQEFQWKYGCVDYNVLIALSYNESFPENLYIFGRFYDKKELDEIRITAYNICKRIVEEVKCSPSELDANLYQMGRNLRKRYGDQIIPRVLNEINY